MGRSHSTGIEKRKKLYISYNENIETIAFSPSCTSHDVKELLIAVCCAPHNSSLKLVDHQGHLVPISPTLDCNSPDKPYQLLVTTARRDSIMEIKRLMANMGEIFERVVECSGNHDDLMKKIEYLESQLQVEGFQAIELEKCKNDLMKLKCKISDELTIPRTGLHVTTPVSAKRDVPLYPKYVLSGETIAYLKQPTFDMWNWEPNEMLALLEHMFTDLNLTTEFKINNMVLKKWLKAVQNKYRNNPFHNFRHCFCVAQMMYGMVHSCNLQKKLSRKDLGILLIACICHDLDHPGFNNTYQINARTELAVRYNDISPLENHHCAVCFEILSDPETNIFANVDKTEFKEIRQGIIDLILATDMARHGEIVTHFRTISKCFIWENPTHIKQLQSIMIKCCDISNEVRPFSVAEPWLECLLEEYFTQSDREKCEGLPVASFMDRSKVTKPTAQIGFIKYVLIPLYETLCELFPEIEGTMLQPLKDAYVYYESKKLEDDLAKDDHNRTKTCQALLNEKLELERKLAGAEKTISNLAVVVTNSDNTTTKIQ
ncbi:high affinity cGMP-specific 3',5'-cyclic phosphodiesterase 9A-like [Bolinopsis microptera]|uniref:high affinity cGMP-specific 3',5'-cyclic phosphodiesterase 9A-like n=1 Tax=Bolinopsis microptera TaxID=2820187 RepID=UPI00307A3514